MMQSPISALQTFTQRNRIPLPEYHPKVHPMGVSQCFSCSVTLRFPQKTLTFDTIGNQKDRQEYYNNKREAKDAAAWIACVELRVFDAIAKRCVCETSPAPLWDLDLRNGNAPPSKYLQAVPMISTYYGWAPPEYIVENRQQLASMDHVPCFVCTLYMNNRQYRYETLGTHRTKQSAREEVARRAVLDHLPRIVCTCGKKMNSSLLGSNINASTTMPNTYAGLATPQGSTMLTIASNHPNVSGMIRPESVASVSSMGSILSHDRTTVCDTETTISELRERYASQLDISAPSPTIVPTSDSQLNFRTSSMVDSAVSNPLYRVGQTMPSSVHSMTHQQGDAFSATSSIPHHWSPAEPLSAAPLFQRELYQSASLSAAEEKKRLDPFASFNDAGTSLSVGKAGMLPGEHLTATTVFMATTGPNTQVPITNDRTMATYSASNEQRSVHSAGDMVFVYRDLEDGQCEVAALIGNRVAFTKKAGTPGTAYMLLKEEITNMERAYRDVWRAYKTEKDQL